ncbi:MAG: hypothetical protein M3Q00_05660 [Pseudomonadota bacterium]|nr:hypothetical protein [Pseudomonadota bacterium]
MTHEALMHLVASLFSIVASLTGQSLASESLPEVRQVPHAEIEAMACQRACRVRAIYLPHRGIYLDDNLDIEHNEFDRSILLHELVHHAQAVTGRYEDLTLCQSWELSELEAYRIQDAYLARVGSAQRILPGIAQLIRCP